MVAKYSFWERIADPWGSRSTKIIGRSNFLDHLSTQSFSDGGISGLDLVPDG